MQDAYQSDDFDDTSSNDATTSESAYEEEEDEARERRVQYTHTHLKSGHHPEIAQDQEQYWRPRTRRTAPVYYGEEQSTRAPTPKVGQLNSNHRRISSRFLAHRARLPDGNGKSLLGFG